MEYLKQLNVAISFASVAFVIMIALQLRCLHRAFSRALAALAVVFALRAVTRTIPPFGEDSPVVIGVLDGLMLVALAVLVTEGRRLVQDLRRQREAAEAAQVEYDLALHSLGQDDSRATTALHDLARRARNAATTDDASQLQARLRELADELSDVAGSG